MKFFKKLVKIFTIFILKLKKCYFCTLLVK
jgi:hypothetical protein